MKTLEWTYEMNEFWGAIGDGGRTYSIYWDWDERLKKEYFEVYYKGDLPSALSEVRLQAGPFYSLDDAKGAASEHYNSLT